MQGSWRINDLIFGEKWTICQDVVGYDSFSEINEKSLPMTLIEASDGTNVGNNDDIKNNKAKKENLVEEVNWKVTTEHKTDCVPNMCQC